MKKFLLAISAFALVFTSCDPTEIEEGSMGASITAEQLQSRVTLTQTTAGQNKFTFETNPSITVQVLDQDGNILTTGTSGSIIGTPPLTGLIVRAINQDGSLVSFKNDVTVTEYVDVPAIYKHLFGPEYSNRTWVWDTEASDGVWGNGGYMSNSGPGWWIIQAADLDQQAIDKGYPDDTIEKGWMKFTLGGKKVEMSRGESGTISWDLSAIAMEGWDIGTLSFDGTTPLLGIQPNDGNSKEYNYHILVTDDDHLRLCAPEAGAGQGGTAWFWNFKVKK
ncbi:hypothetical protein [Parabacteroides sp. ZJ-118]|uniref:hypothetical protein n=1 Tax=Parabacteroides sp. ZJ-118 TaxID=2709398 RepID=UPI0013ED5929|nr:hypothetical protein [Parabacteroides sp. ZJ-118]